MVQPLPYKDIKCVSCPPTSGTIPEPESETFRAVSATYSATLRTVNPATLQTAWSETFLKTILQKPDDAETSYFAEVDLEFSQEIHDKLKQFPPCPGTLKPNPDWFSDYQRDVMEKTQATHKHRETDTTLFCTRKLRPAPQEFKISQQLRPETNTETSYLI